MKLNKIFASLLMLAAVALAACHTTPDNPPVGPGGDDNNDTTVVTPPADEEIDWTALGELPAGCMTVAEALEMGEKLGATDTTDFVYIRGVVKKLTTNCEEAIAGYGNANFYLADSKNAEKDFYAFQVYNVDGAKFKTVEQLVVGDLVVLKCRMINYNGTIESVGKGNGHLVKTTNTYVIPGTQVGEITYEAGELSATEAIAHGAAADTVLVRGQVVEVSEVALTNGNATYYISDGNNQFYCYQCYGLNNKHFTSAEQLKVGDVVTVKGVIIDYNGTLELKWGYITRTTNTAEYTAASETVVTVTEAINIANGLAAGAATESLYRIKGYVINVTEASTSYGNLTFTMGDTETATNVFTCYRVYYIDNKKYTADDPKFEAGDYVEVICQIQNYKGNTPESKGGYVAAHTK